MKFDSADSRESRSRSRSPRGVRLPRSVLKTGLLEFQPGLAGGVRKGFHTSMIQAAVPIEDHLLDGAFLGLLRDGLADRLGRLDVAAGDVEGQGGRRGQGPAGGIVDDLGVNV